ncbi:Glycosyl transferase family 11 [Streptococcus equinus]|uniref:Glycosyl transferase family 11 n=1 Tax=Streptococcus equinus TaxID=1335 RepID=A0A239R9R5_STREI|nr:alpha-1,2-fucosyltransferase [Streptococcus equinus]SNU07577.1 Glycosyl transferase family 11 [Streptococcus equinus]
MIYIIQGGRAGNQLFSYAFAKRVKEIYGDEELCFVLSAIKNKANSESNGEFWEDSLKYFDVDSYTVSYEADIVRKKGSIIQVLLYQIWRLSRKFNNIMFDKTGVEFSDFSLKINKIIFDFISKFGLYIMTHGYSNVLNKSNATNKFIYGSFEDTRWFDDLSSELREEFVPKDKINEECLELYNEIISQNAICVSLRKWSIDVHDSEELVKREICDSSYYERAITYLANYVENPVFVVFSDDLDWASEMVKSIIGNKYPILVEKGNNNVAEKLLLMSSCKHCVVANSTFSWWAAYLNKYKNKIVLSPNIWFKSNYKFHPLILKDWIKIDCKHGGDRSE